mmetsp:Transcript_28012/g.51003  ORF Transcript_28012/g.51003 Transcript_28012/m.51003 type:complete len:1110 (-) Transcript_28012:431-3760(-)
MSRHEVALSGLLLGLVVSVGNGFQSSYLPLTRDVRPATSRRGVSSAYYDGKHGGGRSSSSEEEESVSSATLTYLQTLGSSSIESISSSLTPDMIHNNQDDDVDEEQAAVELRSRVLQDRIRGDIRQPSSTSSPSYIVTLPLVSTKTKGQVAAVSASLGVTLVQMSSNGYSELALDLDSLQFSNSPLAAALAENAVKEEDLAVQFLDKTMTGILEEDDKNLDGVIVSSVVRGGIAWNAGVRAGDTLVATSATMGDKLWPKKTLEGVRSALSSRQIASSEMTLEFRRLGAQTTQISQSQVVETFELSLMRPIGIKIKNNEDGYVEITGFNQDASPFVRSDLRVGDRVVAVESALGGRMWPVSSMDGVTSACTSRLGGQPMRLKFERVVEVGEYNTNTDAKKMNSQTSSSAQDTISPSLAGAVDGSRELQAGVFKASPKAAVAPTIPFKGSQTHQLLLKRCRDVLRRYGDNSQGAAGPTFKDKYAVPAMVADRVLESIADASATLDSKTLTMVMNAYLSCRKPEEAIRAFEVATGMNANGSAQPHTVTIEGKKTPGSRIVPDVHALSLFTGTALLRAHAILGNIHSASRVLAAMEGRQAASIQGIESIAWPGTGKQFLADTRCYNIALAAAVKKSGPEGLRMAIDLFESIAEPGMGRSGKPEKSLVSYNTLIGAFAKAGRSQDAFTIFYDMKQARIMPDKFTYTTLIKACVENGDVRELMIDMRQARIEPDIVTYNTVIKSFCDRYKWYEALKLVTEMETSGVSPDSMTYSLLMNGLLKAGRPGPCLTLFESAAADERTTAVTESVELYTTAITAAATLGDHERALDLVSRMGIRGIKPNIKTLTVFMGGCISAGKTDFAIQMYRKIRTPDGYAMKLGIRAFSEAGDFESAASLLAEQRDGYSQMSGKDVMASYNYVIKAALQQGKYDVARNELTELLESGYIPSKISFLAILEALDLLPLKRTQRKLEYNDPKKAANSSHPEKFDFLLFVLDSIHTRKIPCDGLFYACMLFEGARVGGLRKKIASLLAVAREATNGDGARIKVDEQEIQKREILTWDMLVNHYSEYRDSLNKEVFLPNMRVRITDKDARLVLSAERGLTYRRKVKGSSPQR